LLNNGLLRRFAPRNDERGHSRDAFSAAGHCFWKTAGVLPAGLNPQQAAARLSGETDGPATMRDKTAICRIPGRP
jgi:hypothetical protein